MTARQIRRIRLAQEFALQTAVRQGASMCWVAGNPKLWGAKHGIVYKRLWEIT